MPREEPTIKRTVLICIGYGYTLPIIQSSRVTSALRPVVGNKVNYLSYDSVSSIHRAFLKAVYSYAQSKVDYLILTNVKVFKNSVLDVL